MYCPHNISHRGTEAQRHRELCKYNQLRLNLTFTQVVKTPLKLKIFLSSLCLCASV